MKKIKFGSFPLISIPKEDRDCVDKYSIKNYSDLITLNSAVKSSMSAADKYVTPYSIYKYFKNPSIVEQLSTGDNGLLKSKAETMQRAFNCLKDLSIGIQNIPFYSDKVAFPIYLEHGSNASNDFDYDFLLLTNDLVDKQILDEIHYDDNITMMFLVLKDILYGRVGLPDIGVSNDARESEVKHTFAQFLEACKGYQRNPIDIFVNIIKAAGKAKQKDVNKFIGSKSMLKAKLTANMGSKLNTLFSLGEVKDANFLINAINDKAIHNFLDDKANVNLTTHNAPGITVGNRQTKINEVSEDIRNKAIANATTYTSQLEREYLLNKTHDYNNLLSVVSALIGFNNQKNVIEEVSDGSLKVKVELSTNISIDVNADDMIDKLRTVYFDNFVRALVDSANILFYNYESKARLALPSDVRKEINALRQREYQSRQPNLSNQNKADQYYKDIDKLNDEINSGLLTPDEINVKLEQIDKFYILIKQLNNNAMLEALVANDKKTKIKDENNAQRKFRFEENVESIQGSLVSLLNELESNIYDEDKLKQFINIMRYSNGAPTLDKLTGPSAPSSNIISQFRTTLGIIASEIIYSYETSFRNEVLDVYNYLGADISGLEVEVFDKLNEKGEVISLLMQRMETALLKLLTNMYKDFGTSLSQAKANYAAGRAERNPIIKQTVQKPNNFKTFIISQKILLDLYEILTYIDAQKYIAGLLRFPPSKLSGDLTKMRYIISRLGLSSNPVFIIDQFSRSVILSSPDVLSLTGTPIFNRITNDQMKAICKIDYNKDLWNSKDIFANYTRAKNGAKIKAKEVAIKKIKDELSNLRKKKKPDKNDSTKIKQKEDELRKAETELLKLKNDNSNKLYLSTATKSEFDPNYDKSQQRSPYQQPVQNSMLNSQQVQQFNPISRPEDNGYIPQNPMPQQYQRPQGHMYPGGFQPRRPWQNPNNR